MKLRALSELPSLLKGRRVVLAEGTFDILGVEDLRHLKDARSQGDVLVVALRSDKSCGDAAPILLEGERADLVSGLSCVDYVVLFDEPDASQVVETLRPAIDARRAARPGAVSTSGIIGRILQKASTS
jgi:bifunctional ADP-heptose synthase (sugar kinase/adenylyltransferase)